MLVISPARAQADRAREVTRDLPPTAHSTESQARPDPPRRHRRIAQGARKFRIPTADDLPDADIVLATWWETAEWIWNLPPEKGVKAHFIQDYELWGGTKERVDATCRLPMPKITPAMWVKTLLAKEFGQSDVVCVPNAVDLKSFNAPVRGKQPTPTVGFTYTPFKPKGCDITIEGIRLARLKIPNLRVLCFGVQNRRLRCRCHPARNSISRRRNRS